MKRIKSEKLNTKILLQTQLVYGVQSAGLGLAAADVRRMCMCMMRTLLERKVRSS